MSAALGGSSMSNEIDYACHGGPVQGATTTGRRTRVPSWRHAKPVPADSLAGLLISHLLDICMTVLSRAHLDGELMFRLDGSRAAGSGRRSASLGTSLRYGAITAPGLLQLPESALRTVLSGNTYHDLVVRARILGGRAADRGVGYSSEQFGCPFRSQVHGGSWSACGV